MIFVLKGKSKTSKTLKAPLALYENKQASELFLQMLYSYSTQTICMPAQLVK